LPPLPAQPAPLDPLTAPSNPSNLTEHYYSSNDDVIAQFEGGLDEAKDER